MDKIIEAKDLTVGYDQVVIQKDLNFFVERGSVTAIIGGSGCGKSTLLRSLFGLKRPQKGEVFVKNQSLYALPQEKRAKTLNQFGVLFQTGALFSTQTLLSNVKMPIEQWLSLSSREADALAKYKLAQVGLSGFEDYYPHEISGGMKKRAGLARAMVLDPEILFFDEPHAGLDPMTAKQLDELMLKIREETKSTFIMVTHELDSIFKIVDQLIFLDAKEKTMIGQGTPEWLKIHGNEVVQAFLTRGGERES